MTEENSKDWSFTSHVGEDLRGADLSGANLRRAILDLSLIHISEPTRPY